MIPAIFVWATVSVIFTVKYLGLLSENRDLKAENANLKASRSRKG